MKADIAFDRMSGPKLRVYRDSRLHLLDRYMRSGRVDSEIQRAWEQFYGANMELRARGEQMRLDA